MKIILSILLLTTFNSFALNATSRDSISIKGQLSAFTNINPHNDMPWLSGIRYIPQINYGQSFKNNHLIDFEASANIYGNVSIVPFSDINTTGDIKPYRLWTRYSTNQLEIRAGLQKINFGSASLLRPLMWFDRIDPRDPLKLTDGVWALLARYYFLNNANVWLWGLLGNENRKGWETFGSVKDIPEFGGRLQLPVPKGETGLSYHHRVAGINSDPASITRVPENRFGIDAKFDMTIGWWIEASWSNYRTRIILPNQETINLGVDYTFGLGNGLTVIYEQLFGSSDIKPFAFHNTRTFSLLSLVYPLSVFDNLSAIVYYDWTNTRAYNFLTWQHQLNKFTFYLMGYINPLEYNIPSQDGNNMIFAGSGLQLMLVFNH